MPKLPCDEKTPLVLPAKRLWRDSARTCRPVGTVKNPKALTVSLASRFHFFVTFPGYGKARSHVADDARIANYLARINKANGC